MTLITLIAATAMRHLRLIIRRTDCCFPALCHWKSPLLSGPQITNRICLTSLQQRSSKLPSAVITEEMLSYHQGIGSKIPLGRFQLFDQLIGIGVLGFLKPRSERCLFQGWTLLCKDVKFHFLPESRLCGAVNASSLLRCLHYHPALLLCCAFAHGFLPTLS